MYTTIVIFYVSLVCIVSMLFSKRAESLSGKKSFLSRLGDGTDHVVHSVYGSVRFFISHINAHNAIVLVQWIAFHILSTARAFYLHVKEIAHSHPHSKKVIDMVTGKGEISHMGGASFYLKHIGEEVKK